MRNLNDEIRLNKEILAQEDIVINTIATEIKSNKVIIGIYPFTEDAKQKLLTRYGNDNVVIVEDDGGSEESRTSRHIPLKGGIRIDNIESGKGYCTHGFSATSSSWRYGITAGHCGSAGDRFNQGGYYYGKGYISKNSGNVDAMAITYGQTSYSSNENYAKSDFSSWQDESEEYVGQPICMNGSYTGNSCGTIRSTYYSVRNHYDMSAANYSSQGGDSGSPVYTGSKLVGIHEGSNGSTKVYTQIENFVNSFNLSPVTW
ncbi:S1 family peptidase [Metabacillus sp. HB246100]